MYSVKSAHRSMAWGEIRKLDRDELFRVVAERVSCGLPNETYLLILPVYCRHTNCARNGEGSLLNLQGVGSLEGVDAKGIPGGDTQRQACYNVYTASQTKRKSAYRSWDCHAKSRLLSTLRSIRPCTTSRLWTSIVIRVMIFARDSLVNLPKQKQGGFSGG